MILWCNITLKVLNCFFFFSKYKRHAYKINIHISSRNELLPLLKSINPRDCNSIEVVQHQIIADVITPVFLVAY